MTKSPQDPSAVLASQDAIKMLRDIHEEYKDDDSARGYISSKAAMAFIEAYESQQARIKELERENARMREAVMYAKSMSADADDEEEPNSCLWLINKSMSEVLSFSSHE